MNRNDKMAKELDLDIGDVIKFNNQSFVTVQNINGAGLLVKQINGVVYRVGWTEMYFKFEDKEAEKLSRSEADLARILLE